MSRSTQAQQSSREPITDLNARMGFGKYRNERVQEVIDVDPGYILWLRDNTDIEISTRISEAAEDAARPNHEFRYGEARFLRGAIDAAMQAKDKYPEDEGDGWFPW